jgi:hypothetical protein
MTERVISTNKQRAIDASSFCGGENIGLRQVTFKTTTFHASTSLENLIRDMETTNES